MKEKKEEHIYLEVNGDFRMRELDKSDLEQFNALLQYAFHLIVVLRTESRDLSILSKCFTMDFVPSTQRAFYMFIKSMGADVHMYTYMWRPERAQYWVSSSITVYLICVFRYYIH